MGKQLSDLSFEDWLAYAFDHPVTDVAWHWDLERDDWDELKEPAVTVGYLTRLFENAGDLLAPFSNAQLNQGLWFLADNACSSHMFALIDPKVPWSQRKQGLESMYSLFEQVFLPRCDPAHLSHLDRTESTETDPLNRVCYMWWDILPIGGRPETAEQVAIGETCIEVMRQTLELDSQACQESALHGLGHWHFGHPARVEAIIKTFLQGYEPRKKRQKKQRPAPSPHPLRPELRVYALSAQTGCVL